MKVAVIGAGVLGASVGWNLSRLGAKVIFIDAGQPGYYEAVSHSGITLGPVIGQLLASEIANGKRDELLADFRPERFSDVAESQGRCGR